MKLKWLAGLSVAAVALTACQTTPIQGRDKQTLKLDQWVDQSLTPYLSQQLSKHPKFKGQPILIVAMDNGEILPEIDGLRSHIRNRISSALISTQGVNLVNRSPRQNQNHQRSLKQVRCNDADDIRYYIGIDIQRSPLTEAMNVSVRAIDAQQNNAWVSGFGQTSDMSISQRQKDALAQLRSDEYLRGLRVLPFDSNEPDLLASYMAHNLSCLMRSGNVEGDIRIAVNKSGSSTPATDTTFNLIESYLTRFNEISVTGKPALANTHLKMALHPIDSRRGLYLMSADIERVVDGKRHGGMATQSYIYIDPRQLRTTTATTPTKPVVAKPATPAVAGPGLALTDGNPIAAGIIADMQIVTPSNLADCQAYNPWANGDTARGQQMNLRSGQCFGLSLTSSQQANVYLLYAGANGKVQRLQPTQCSALQGSPAKVQAGQTLRYPAKSSQAKVIELDARPGAETVYGIAISDAASAAQFEQLISAYPDICGGQEAIRITSTQAQPKLRTLADRLNSFKANNQGMDWQKISINHLP